MDIVHMQTFVAVVEERSFTAAGERLGVAKSVCSRRIAELETDLGTQLVLRSTRSVAPTDAGQIYYQGCLDILERIAAANAIAKCESHRISGKLRLSVPIGYFHRKLAGRIEEFADLYPEVELDLRLTDRLVDLISEGFDAAVRIGNLGDSNLFARKIGVTRAVLCASPDYLAKQGEPKNIQELGSHLGVIYTNAASGSEWSFPSGDKTVKQRIKGRFHCNSGDYQLRLGCKGYGIINLPDFYVENALAEGQLRPILTEFPQYDIDIQVVFSEKKNMRAVLRAFIDHLAKG